MRENLASTSIMSDFLAYLPTFTVFLPLIKDYRKHYFTILQSYAPIMTVIVLRLPHVAQTFYAQHLVLVVSSDLHINPLAQNLFSLMSVATLKHLAACKKRH